MVPGCAKRSAIEISGLVRLVEEEAKECSIGRGFPGRTEVDVELRRGGEGYYFHRFYDFQPDLNTANPEVQAEILKIMGFWLQLGVSGFRMDAVPFVIAKKGADQKQPGSSTTCCATFSEFLTWRKGEAIILGEANVLPSTDLEYFGETANGCR